VVYKPTNELGRRDFLLSGIQGIGSAWMTLHWSAVISAAEHAAHARQAVPAAKFEVLSAEEAAEIDAVASRIIPSDGSPGAREAAVIYFIDRALATFSSENRVDYRQGLPVLQAKTQELFPAVKKFSQASLEQQDQVLKAVEGEPVFELIRTHTIMGFLADPARRGNLEEVGWKVIGFDSSPAFTPPFGFYDRDYPGWQAPAEEHGNK